MHPFAAWELDGLPLHPLVVHAPVVLVPLVTAGVGLSLLRPGLRRTLLPAVAVLALTAAAAAIVAVPSGAALGEARRHGPELDDHRTLGELTRTYAVLLALTTVGLALYDRRPARDERRVGVALACVLPLAVGCTASVAFTGHTGATLAWAAPPIPAATTVPPAAAPTTAPPAAGATPATPGVDVVLGEWALVTSTGEAPPGATTFRIRNAGTVTHAFRIRTPGSGRDRLEWRSPEVAPGGETTFVVDLPAGSYELTCPIEDANGEHDALGMRNTFAGVEGAPVPTAPPATPPPQPPDASGSGAVGISAFSFAPVEITVAAGSEVVWTNQDPASHTATGDGFDTGAVPPGGSGRARFDAAGRFEYHCTIHPGMTGAVVVT